MPSKFALLFALDACLDAGPMPAEPDADMHQRCTAWAVVEARRLDQVARMGYGFPRADYLANQPPEEFTLQNDDGPD